MPYGIRTIPEIPVVVKSEKALTEVRNPLEVRKFIVQEYLRSLNNSTS